MKVRPVRNTRPQRPPFLNSAGGGGGVTPPASFQMTAFARMAVIGDSIDIGPVTDGFVEAMGQKLYVPAGWNFAVAGTEVVEKSQSTSPFWSPTGVSTTSSPTQCATLITTCTASGMAPDIVLIGASENSITHGDTDTNILAGYAGMIADLVAAFPSVKILIRQMAGNWVNVTDDQQTKVTRAVAVWNGLVAMASGTVFPIDTGHYISATGGVTPTNYVGYDGTSATAYDHAAAGFGYNTASGSKAEGSNHPNTAKGAPFYGQIMAAQVLPLLVGSDASLFPTDTGGLAQNQELNPNWNMPGTGGTISSGGSGQLANNCVWTNTSDVAATLSKATALSGAVCQRISFNGVATVNGIFKNVMTVVPNQTLKAGRAYLIDVEVDISNNAGDGNAIGLYHLTLNQTNGQAIGTGYQIGSVHVSADGLKRTAYLRIRTNVLVSDLTSLAIELYGQTAARTLDILINQARCFTRVANKDPVNRTLDIEAVTSVQEGAAGTFRFSRPHTVGTFTLNYTSSGTGGSPASAADFSPSGFPGGSATIPAGATYVDVPWNAATDGTTEGNETFQVAITAPSTGAYRLGPNATRVATITEGAVSPNANGTNNLRASGSGTVADALGSLTVTKGSNLTAAADAGAPNGFSLSTTSATSTGVLTGTGYTPQATVSYTAWINPTAVASLQGIFAEGRATQVAALPELQCYIQSSNGKVRVSFAGVLNALESSSALTAAAYSFIALVIDPDPVNSGKVRLTLYVNGVANSVSNLTQRSLTTTKLLNAYANASDAPTANPLVGTHQGIRAYNGYALSSTEVSQLYALGRDEA